MKSFMSRAAAIARAQASFDDGSFVADLARRVAIPSSSQEPARAGALRSYRWSKIGAIVILSGAALWAWTISRMLNDNSNLGAKFDSSLLFTQVFGAIAFIGGSAAILWNLRTVWAGNRRWPAKTWSLVLALAAAAVLWTGIVFKLISFGLNY